MYAAEVDQALALPIDEAVSRLATLREGQWYERKSGRVSPKDLAAPLVAFANAEGGCLVVGIHDGIFEGVLPTKVNAIRQAAQDFTRPVVRAHTEVHTDHSGRTLLVLRVDPGDTVHETAGGDCYLRVGDESRKLGFAQRQELEYDRGATTFDGTAVQASVADLSGDQLEDYRKAIGSSSVAAMLRARGLLRQDGQLTVAGYLLFAEHPQGMFPNAYVRVLRYTDVERRSGARLTLDDAGDIRCDGSLPTQITTAADAVERLVPQRRALGADGRFSGHPIVPRDAWLEGLVNAVLHRSYSMVGDHVRVEIFPDRIEVASPGRFPGIVDPARPLDISRYARNPRIARVCSDLGLAQELGEGIRRMFDEMRTSGLTDPSYVQTASSVRLVLSAADAIPESVRAGLSRGALGVLDVLRRAGRPLGTGQVADAAAFSRPTVLRHLHALQDVGLITWTGQGAKDPRATWQPR
jgi:ATP-dependent DNA helicase RecG